jgi:hypothetical protein
MKASHCRGSYSLMRIMVSAAGEHTISVSQIDERCHNRHDEYDYSNCRVILAKIEKDSDNHKDLELKYIKATANQDRETHINIENIEKGEYFVYIEMDWNENTEDTEFCSTCYGSSRTFYLRDEKSLYDKNEILRKILSSKAIQLLDGATV